MRKYWKLISILLVSVLTVGTFYLNAAFAKSPYPDYSITKISGDEKEIESITVLGGYSNNSLDDEFTLNLGGIEYASEESFLERANGQFYDPQMKQVQKDYWNFTRGKISNPVNYYSDDTYLAYSNMDYNWSFSDENNQFTFQISVLNKETKKITSFDLNLPNGGAYSFVNTARVQMVGDELQVITRNSVDYPGEGEYHLYIFDIANKKLKSGELLLSVPKSSDDQIDVFLLDERTIERTNEYAVFSQIIMQDTGVIEEITEEETVVTEDVVEYQEEATSEGTEDITLFLYHFKTGKLETIDLPEDIQGSGYAFLFDGSHIYSPETDEQGTEMVVYDLESKEIKNTFPINMDIDTMRVKNEKLYSLKQDANTVRISVVDLTSGEMLYEGEATPKSDAKPNEKEAINFYGIAFK